MKSAKTAQLFLRVWIFLNYMEFCSSPGGAAQSKAVIEWVEDKLGSYFILPEEMAAQWISCSLEICPVNAGIERKGQGRHFRTSKSRCGLGFVSHDREDPAQ